MLMIKLDQDLLYCGSLGFSPVTFDITDLTNDAVLSFTSVSFTEVAPSTVTFSSIFPTLRDFSSMTNTYGESECLLPFQIQTLSGSSATPTDSDCGCYNEGVCDSSSGECSCLSGYAPPKCRYSLAEQTSYSTLIEEELAKLSLSIGSLTTDQILSRLKYFTSYPDLLTSLSASRAVEIAS